jgi:hypothetical protein
VREAALDLQRYLAQATGQFLRLEPTTGDGVNVIVGYTGDGGAGDAAGIRTPGGAESYALKRDGDRVIVLGADEAGAVYGVYGLLEAAYGCAFFLGSEVVPPGTQPLLPEELDVQRSPAFATRGLLPWYDFLSGPTAWNLADYKLYVDRMLRMGLNFLGLHVYSHGSVNHSSGAEPFLSFEYRGVGHDAYLDTSFTERWGYQPMRTSLFEFGTDHYFPREIFGADAAIDAVDSLDAIAKGKALLQEALRYAKARGMKLCVGFEPAAIPQEIVNALPKNAIIHKRSYGQHPTAAIDLTSAAALEILHLRLDDLLATYPEVDAIWLWQNEDAAWTLQHSGSDILPFDTGYIRAAYDYLKENAPQVQLVVSGWGSVHALFDGMHQELPQDVAFSALNHNLGTSETDEVYGRLDGRNRWPIPWLEDDATLWHPQYYVYRFQNDIQRAHRFGADGMIGIHWRTRVIDHIAGYFSHALWQPDLDGADFYRWYGERISGDDTFAAAIEPIDRAHDWPGYIYDEAVGGGNFNGGHSNEAGTAFLPHATADSVLNAYNGFAATLADLPAKLPADAAERVRYHAAQAQFARYYVASQSAARAIDTLVADVAASQRSLTEQELAGALAQLDLAIAAVRDAVTVFAGVQTTTADLGVLSSLNQKYIQRAIWQRFDAIREVAPAGSNVPKPTLPSFEPEARLFVPVPPERIEGETVVEVFASRGDITDLALVILPLHDGAAQRIPMSNKGRGVWVGAIAGDVPVRYWVEARAADGRTLRAPEADGLTFSAIAPGK